MDHKFCLEAPKRFQAFFHGTDTCPDLSGLGRIARGQVESRDRTRPFRSIVLVFTAVLSVAIFAHSQGVQEAVRPAPVRPAAELAPSTGENHGDSTANQSHRDVKTAIVMAQNGDFEGAITLLSETLKRDPSLATAHYNLGLALLGTGDTASVWTEAIEQFRAALRLKPGYPEAHRMLGIALLVNGDIQGAIRELKLATNEDPEVAEAHLDLGKAFAAAGRWGDAADEFHKAIALRHPYPQAEAHLGNVLLNQGQTSAAASAFLDALHEDPDIEMADYGLARALQREGKASASQIEFREAHALIQRKSDAVMSSNLSNQSLLLASHGKSIQAEAMAKRAVELAPDNWMAVYNYGLLLADTGNLSGGIGEVRKAISLMPMRRRLYLTMAQMQRQIGEDRAAGCSVNRADHLLQWASAHGDAASLSPEAEKCRTSNQKFPFGASFGNADEHGAFAAYLSSRGDLLGATGELLYSIKLAPSRADSRYSLALVWLQMGKLRSAVLELRQVLILTPQSEKAHLALGAALARLKGTSD